MSDMKTAGTLNETQAMDIMKGGGGAGTAATSKMKVASEICIIGNDGKVNVLCQ